MKLFSQLNSMPVINRPSVTNTALVNVTECANITYNSLMIMHILRQEALLSEAVKNYACDTLKSSSNTHLFEFLQVLHTEVLREHAYNEPSEFNANEIDAQIRLTQEFLQSLTEDRYNVIDQNFRLLQLENCYKITKSHEKKLRREIRNWHNEGNDVRYKICSQLWENVSSRNGLIDLNKFLQRFMQEQKWPSPGSGQLPEVPVSKKLTLLNRLSDQVIESATAGSTSAGSVATVANPVGQISRRPNLFGYIPEDQDEDEGKDLPKKK